MADRFERGAEAGAAAKDAESQQAHNDEHKRARFLEALAAGDSVRAAAAAAGVSPAEPYVWRRSDSGFKAAWLAAEEAGTDLIEEEAFRRAVKGVEKPVYRGGEVVGHVADYSDTMLMFLLKSRRPERYGAQAKASEGESAQDLAKRLNLKGARDALIGKFASVAARG